MTSESQTRKNKSIAILVGQGIPFIDHLPEIEDSTESVLRSPKEIVERARCFFAVFFAVNRRERSKGLEIVERYDLKSRLSRREQVILQPQAPSEAEQTDLSWECESLIALVWALGVIDVMPPPTDGIHPDSLAIGWTLITEKNWAGTSARLLGDVLNQRDLYYRYHWAVREAWLKGSPAPTGLVAGVVSERHRALNWLTSNEWDDWDEVTADT